MAAYAEDLIGPPPERTWDEDDDPAVACTVQRLGPEDEPIGPEVTADGKKARANGKVVAKRLDAETVRSRDRKLTFTWATDSHGDAFMLVTWLPHGLYRSYRFWDDALVAFYIDEQRGMRFRYDIIGCDRHELVLGIAGAWNGSE